MNKAWLAGAPRRVATLQGHTQLVRALRLTRDGGALSGSHDALHLWSPAGDLLHSWRDGALDVLKCLDVGAGGGLGLSGHTCGGVAARDLATGATLGEWRREDLGLQGPAVDSVQVRGVWLSLLSVGGCG